VSATSQIWPINVTDSARYVNTQTKMTNSQPALLHATAETPVLIFTVKTSAPVKTVCNVIAQKIHSKKQYENKPFYNKLATPYLQDVQKINHSTTTLPLFRFFCP